jgi:putative DNA primase/helicase
MVAEFTTTQSIYLSAAHQQHIERRGLLGDWARANCRTVNTDEASFHLGYKAKSGGILFESANRQIQFKPDKPWKSADGKKAPKYRSPAGEYDAFLPQHPTDKNYWEPENLKKHCWQIDGHPCLPITEGPFKAIAGCEGGIPTIALLGVSMGLTSKDADIQNKRYLVPALERYARAGFGFIFAFDADAATNPNVTWEQRKLGRQLLKFNVPVYSITGAWDAGQTGETKGMDDFIQKKGIEEFRLMLARSVRFEDWESSLGDSSSPKFSLKPPAPQELGAQFAEDLRDRLCYSEEHKSWMKYELQHRGVWGEVSDDYVLAAIHGMSKARGTVPNNAYCANVLGAMKRELYEHQWQERSSNELLPFEDGVLEVESGQWHEHAPGFRLTWSLPRSYKGAAVRGWSKIEKWLDQATEGSERKKNILLAFAAAALRGMANLQKFLMLTGFGGTGKGLCTRLLTMIVGERNTWIGNLEDLTKDPKVAELQTKRLAVFDDQEKYMGNLSNFRSMTGGGFLSGRALYKSPVKFRFPGLVLITANQPCFPASGLSWLKRRIVQEEFRYVPHRRNVDLESELEPELSAFTQYLLSIPVADIKRLLNPENSQINISFWEDRVRADPLASWVNDCVIYDPAAKTPIGADKDEWKDRDCDPTKSTLFGAYNHYCRCAGYAAKGKNNFSADLEELCLRLLDWKGVEKKRLESGMSMVGLRLRTNRDASVLTTDEMLAANPDADPDADLAVDLKTLPDKHSVDPVDLVPKLSAKVALTEDSIDSECDVGEKIPPPIPAESTGSLQDGGYRSTVGSVGGLQEGLQEDSEPSEPFEPPNPPAPIAAPAPTQSSCAAPQESSEPPAAASQESSEPPTPPAPTQLESSEPATDLNESEVELVGFVRTVLADADPETAKHIQAILSEVCGSGGASRVKVWGALSESEQTEFSGLLKAPRAPEPEPAPALLIESPVAPETAPETPSPIAPADAEAFREIALDFWGNRQSSLAQMFGWGEPGTKYSSSDLSQWLESQEQLVRDRIGELMGLHFSEEVPGPIEPPEDEIDCGF